MSLFWDASGKAHPFFGSPILRQMGTFPMGPVRGNSPGPGPRSKMTATLATWPFFNMNHWFALVCFPTKLAQNSTDFNNNLSSIKANHKTAWHFFPLCYLAYCNQGRRVFSGDRVRHPKKQRPTLAGLLGTKALVDFDMSLGE